MEINNTMDLNQLAERMGDMATKSQARHMRDILINKKVWNQTEDIPEYEWLQMLESADIQTQCETK